MHVLTHACACVANAHARFARAAPARRAGVVYRIRVQLYTHRTQDPTQVSILPCVGHPASSRGGTRCPQLRAPAIRCTAVGC
eukprot:COSAG02_NODE_4530_length_5252_cov_5.919658_7_plen_82_part_00